MANFGTLNWTILIVYLCVNILLGFFLSKKISGAKDFYVGNKQTPWWAIGISVLATYVSALTFLGAPAWSYKEGLSVIAIHLNYPLVIVIVITLFLPFFLNSGVVSIYEYLEKRFGKETRAVSAGIFLFNQTVSSAAILYITSLVIEFITGLDVITCIFLVTVIALIYTVMGGITAVIWTDVVQSIILLLGGAIIMYALIDNVKLPLGETLSELKGIGKLNAVNWSFDWTEVTTVWTGVIAMSIYHTSVYGANQMMIQRTLASKNIGDAKKSMIMMGFGAFFIYFMFILMGVLFYNYYEGKEFSNDNRIVLQFANDYGLPGLMGIIASAVVAASMSSLDSAFNSLSTVSTVGFYQKYIKKDASDVHYLKVTRWFTLFWAILVIIPAIVYTNTSGSVLEIMTKVGSFFVGATLSMYGLGFFSKHTNQKGLIIGVVLGIVAVGLASTMTSIAWPWYCLIGIGTNILISLPASILLDGRQSEWHEYSVVGQMKMFKAKQLKEKQGGWYLVPGKIDRASYYLIGFFVFTVVFLIVFESYF